MKNVSLKEIRNELQHLTPEDMLQLCLRMIRFKKETKELAAYVLFHSGDEQGYVRSTCEMLDELFAGVNANNLFFAKKNIRKIIRLAGRYIKYSAEATTETEILIHVLEKMKSLPINYKKSTQLQNMYTGLLKKIHKSIEGLHEDLQYDYLQAIRLL